MRCLVVGATGLVLFVMAGTSFGAISIHIPSHTRDSNIRNTGSSRTDAITMAVGRRGGVAGQRVPLHSSVAFFELPSVTSGQDILDAHLRVSLDRSMNLSSGENVDLYGLGYVTDLPPEHSINSSWYYSGSLDTRSGNVLDTNLGAEPVTKIIDDWVTPNTEPGHVHTNNVADAALTSFVQELYDKHNATGGDYLVLRLNGNRVFKHTYVDYHRYFFHTSDNGDPETHPTLTLTVVPAPSSLTCMGGLFAVGLIASSLRRRKASPSS